MKNFVVSGRGCRPWALLHSDAAQMSQAFGLATFPGPFLVLLPFGFSQTLGPQGFALLTTSPSSPLELTVGGSRRLLSPLAFRRSALEHIIARGLLWDLRNRLVAADVRDLLPP